MEKQGDILLVNCEQENDNGKYRPTKNVAIECNNIA